MSDASDLLERLPRRWPAYFGDAPPADPRPAAIHLLRLLGALVLAHLFRRGHEDEEMASRVRQYAADPTVDRLVDLVDAFARRAPEAAAELFGDGSVETLGAAPFAAEVRRVMTPLRGGGDVGALPEENVAFEFLRFALDRVGAELDRREGGPFLRGPRGALLPLRPFVALDREGLARPLAGFEADVARFGGPHGDVAEVDDPAVLRALASFAIQVGMYARAAALHDHLQARHGKPAADRDGEAARHALRGYRHYRGGEYARAAAEIRQALVLRPDLTNLYYQLCLAHTKLGETHEAARVLERLLDRVPDSRKAHELLGDLHMERGEATQALARYERARRLSPMDPLLEKKAERARAHKATRRDPAPSEGDEATRGRVVEEYLVDMTAEAAAGRYHPVVGRERESEETIEILCCRDKNNPLLVGDSGVGKTALVEDLVLRIAEGKVPDRLGGRKVYLLNVATLLAGAKYRGQFEERMLELLGELRGENCIVFLDNLQTLVGSGLTRGGGLDTASLIRPALTRGEIQAIGATTFEEYHGAIEREPAFARCFQPVKLDEPDAETTGRILLAAKGRFEAFHGVRFDEAGLLASVELVKRCQRDGRLPDTALDVMDLAAARVAMAVAGAEREDAVVGEDDLLEALAHRTGIPLARLAEPLRRRLLGVEESLARRVVGQEAAIRQIAPVVRSTRQGIKLHPGRPNGVFLFAGPSGVGKTEMARALAEFLFGNEDKLVRIDMSEYMERIAASRLIGAAPGYVGYNDPNQLTDRMRRDPYAVVLLDEIEKADGQTLNLFLQVFDAGRLTDGRGRTASFSHATVIMTSNVGTELYGRPRAGYQEARSALGPAVSREALLREIKKRFQPEFLNRIDEIVFFEPLGHAAICRIARMQLDGLTRTLGDQGKELMLTPEALDRLAGEGYSFEYGARNLGRVLRKRVLDPLAVAALGPAWHAARRVVLAVEGGDLILRLEPDRDGEAVVALEASETPVDEEPAVE